MPSLALGVLLALQSFVVLFLALHDWIPLGTLNDVKAARAANPGGKLLTTTLMSFVPYAFGLVGSFVYFARGFPEWLWWWLWISYGLLFWGLLRAWWIPYLFRAEPQRAERYRAMFGGTHAFLPERNGIQPNTLHVMFHAATVAILIVLGVLTWWPG